MKNIFLFTCLMLAGIAANGQSVIPVKFSSLQVQAIDTGSYGIGIENSLGTYTNCRYKLPPAIDTASLSARINAKIAYTDTATAAGTKYDVDTADKNTRLYAQGLVSGAGLSAVLAAGNTATNNMVLNDGVGDQAVITGSSISSAYITSGFTVDKLQLQYNQFAYSYTYESDLPPNTTYLQFTAPTADRNIVFPDAGGQVALTNDSSYFSSRYRTDSADANVRAYIQANYLPLSAYATGSAILSTGTVTVSLSGCSATSTVLVQLKMPGSGPNGAQYKVAPGAGMFTITAVNTSGATVMTDNSTLKYLIFY